MTEAQNVPNLSRILVATDLSPRAQKDIARAAQLAHEHGAALTILHVLTDAAGNKARLRHVALQVEKDLRRDIATLSSAPDGMTTIRVVTGPPFVEIIRRAREEAADLILVGAHGAQFIKDVLIGTTMEKIVRKGDRACWPSNGRFVLHTTVSWWQRISPTHRDKRWSSACGLRPGLKSISCTPIRELRDNSGGPI